MPKPASRPSLPRKDKYLHMFMFVHTHIHVYISIHKHTYKCMSNTYNTYKFTHIPQRPQIPKPASRPSVPRKDCRLWLVTLSGGVHDDLLWLPKVDCP